MKTAEQYVQLFKEEMEKFLNERLAEDPNPEKELATIIHQAQDEAYAAGQEAMRQAVQDAKVCVPNVHIGRDFDLYMAGITQALTTVRNLPIQPLPTESLTNE